MAAKLEPVLVSACLVGRRCRYDGSDNRDRLLEDALARDGFEAVPFCPEEAGGLPTPRPPAWIEGTGAAAVVDGESRVVDVHGRDATGEFLAGARGALRRCEELGIRRAFLKERSPSCGCSHTHVDGALVEGPGVTAVVLRRAGVVCEGVAGRRS